MASPFPVGRAPPLPRQLKGGSKRARILCRRQPQCPHPAALRFCRAFRGGFAAAPPSTRLPRRLSILSIQPPRRLALLPARWACAFAAIKRPPAFSRRRLRFFRAFRASTAALGHPFRTATSTLGAPSRAMALVPSPPSNALPLFHGGGFASSALSVHLPRRLGILSAQLPRRLALLPARWACAFAAGKRLPTFRGGGFASSALSVHLPRRLGILSIQPPRRLALLPARWACAFAAIKRPPAFSRRRLRGFRAFPFRRASLLPLSLSPRLLALRSPAVFPASKSRKNSGRGIDRARWRASVTDSIWLSIPRPAASKAVRGGAYRPARRRP